MEIDLGSVMRLKAALDRTLEGADGDRAHASKALADGYAAMRTEAALLATSADVTEEFERMFPEPVDVKAPKSRGGYDGVAIAGLAQEQYLLLSRLSGWLDGFVQKARLDGEARAYAEARLQAEGRDG